MQVQTSTSAAAQLSPQATATEIGVVSGHTDALASTSTTSYSTTSPSSPFAAAQQSPASASGSFVQSKTQQSSSSGISCPTQPPTRISSFSSSSAAGHSPNVLVSPSQRGFDLHRFTFAAAPTSPLVAQLFQSRSAPQTPQTSPRVAAHFVFPPQLREHFASGLVAPSNLQQLDAEYPSTSANSERRDSNAHHGGHAHQHHLYAPYPQHHQSQPHLAANASLYHSAIAAAQQAALLGGHDLAKQGSLAAALLRQHGLLPGDAKASVIAAVLHNYQMHASACTPSDGTMFAQPRAVSEGESDASLQESPSAATPAADGNRQHFCKVCSRTFSRSDMLTRHQRLHTGEYIVHVYVRAVWVCDRMRLTPPLH